MNDFYFLSSYVSTIYQLNTSIERRRRKRRRRTRRTRRRTITRTTTTTTTTRRRRRRRRRDEDIEVHFYFYFRKLFETFQEEESSFRFFSSLLFFSFQPR
jgi:hypothetical protein